MASHAPALVLPFGDIATIQAPVVKAALYEGAQHYMKPQPGLKGGRETFAAITFAFKSCFSERIVPAEVRVGKFVGNWEEKFVEVTGVNGKKIRLDPVNYIVDFVDERGNISPATHLFAHPIHLLIRETFAGRVMLSLLSPELGRVVVNTLES